MAEQQTVEILMEGGLVTGVKAPKGVTVKITDYDVEGTTETVKQDENGADCIEFVYVGTGEWDS